MHIALIAPEGTQTSDRRQIAPGALTWRDNIPLMFIDRTTAGHDDAVHVGNATNLRRETVAGETWIVADVEYDTDGDATEAMRLADEDKIAGVSADLAVARADVEITEVDDEGFPVDWIETVQEAEIIGFTQLPMPAFAGAKIVRSLETLTAAANPKAKTDWFGDPKLTGPTPLTVTDDGQVYGHLATWGTCHIGYDGVCVTPPASSKNYSYFCTGAVRVDGEDVPVGHITLGTGHASMSADAGATVAHYDNTGTVAADIVAGEDDYGIWVAGATRPGVDLDALRAASLSGDWRSIGGNLELVAALAVNVPGFPVPRIAASIAQGEQTSLVASGIVQRKDDMTLVFDALNLIQKQLSELTAEEPEQDAEVLDMTPAGRIARLLG